MFKCKECGTSFTRPDNLVRHMKRSKHFPNTQNDDENLEKRTLFDHIDSESLDREKVILYGHANEYKNNRDELGSESNFPTFQKSSTDKSYEQAYTPSSSIQFKVNALKRRRMGENLMEMEKRKRIGNIKENYQSANTHMDSSEAKGEDGSISEFDDNEDSNNEKGNNNNKKQDEYNNANDEEVEDREYHNENSSLGSDDYSDETLSNEEENYYRNPEPNRIYWNNSNEYNNASDEEVEDREYHDEKSSLGSDDYSDETLSNEEEDYYTNSEPNRIYWNNPNKLVDRLRFLTSNKEGVEIFKILTELRNYDIIE